MSLDALNWAIAQDLKPSSSKFVLLALADVAQETGLAFPSIERIERFTSLNRKTIISALDDLLDKGKISDTGKRVGRTSQVKVYELALVRESLKYVPLVCEDPKAGSFQGKNGTVPNQKRDSSETGTLRKKTVPIELVEPSRDVLDYLNRVGGLRYQPTPTNLRFIADRLLEGYTAHLLKLVAFHRLVTWRNKDPAMLEYLRPSTLYNAEKCNQYAGQVPAVYFKKCTCGADVLPDRGPCCEPPAEPVPARQPMPEHIRRREGETVRAWMDRLKQPAEVTA